MLQNTSQHGKGVFLGTHIAPSLAYQPLDAPPLALCISSSAVAPPHHPQHTPSPPPPAPPPHHQPAALELTLCERQQELEAECVRNHQAKTRLALIKALVLATSAIQEAAAESASLHSSARPAAAGGRGGMGPAGCADAAVVADSPLQILGQRLQMVSNGVREEYVSRGQPHLQPAKSNSCDSHGTGGASPCASGQPCADQKAQQQQQQQLGSQGSVLNMVDLLSR